MNNQEAADELQYAIDLIKQDGKDWLDERDIPVLEMAISALQAQEAKTQLSAKGTTFDLISRQAAIDALMEFDKKLRKINWYQYPHTEYECRGVDEAIVKIENVPSAQPEPLVKESRTLVKDLVKDTINRKAAIDAVENIDCSDGVGISALKCEAVDDVVTAIKALPSAQPEPQWIPVGERLPEVGKDVMVCYDFKGHRSVLIGVFYGDEEFHGYDDEYLTPEGRKYRKAVAWMPLPEPYAERRTDDLQ